jgi:hypothetical protein
MHGRVDREHSRVLVARSELRLVPVGLLEVVARDLLDLGGAATGLALEEASQTLVQIGADGLRERRVGRVPQEEVPEAVPVLEVGSPKRTDDLLADELAEGHVDRLLTDELEDRPPRELLPDDRRTIDHLALVLL